MTSSLPNFPAAPAPASAAPAHAASNADFDVTSAEPTGDFADLMSDEDAAAVCPDTATATPNFTILAPTLISLLGASAAEASAESADVTAVPGAEATDEAALLPDGISRDAMEQAASLLTTILQSVLPETTAVPAAEGGARTSCGLEPARSAGSSSRDALTAGPAVPATTDAAALAAEASVVAESATPSCTFEATLAADGTVEINATLPPAKEQGSAEKSSSRTASASADTGAMEIEAELALPGQAVIRLSASNAPDDALRARANFAERNPAAKITPHSLEAASERNFLVAGEKELKTDSTLAGITVAKTESTMKPAPTDSTRAASNLDTILGLPERGQFAVAWPAAERAGEATVAPLEKNFAERAVATVNNLVDTQFNASMQKSGSVQLRLKFGGEDLSVRVELRGGAVHTDFRTDSPELRAALNREWQAVAGQSSESLRRFVEPVFSPSSSNGGDSSSSFARQQAAQQDLPQQRSPRSREEDTMTFTRRSLVGETFSPQPAAPRAPALVPTSLRLSVLA